MLTDRDSYSNDIRHLFDGDGPATSDDIGGLGFTDPPQHTRLRKIVTPEFTMRRLARLMPIIEDIVDGQLDQMEATGLAGGPRQAPGLPGAVPDDLRPARPRLRRPGRIREARQRPVRRSPRRAAAFGAVSEQREFLFEAIARQRLNPGPGSARADHPRAGRRDQRRRPRRSRRRRLHRRLRDDGRHDRARHDRAAARP